MAFASQYDCNIFLTWELPTNFMPTEMMASSNGEAH